MNKDLHLVLDAMLRQARQMSRHTGLVSPFAAILTSKGKVSILIGPAKPANDSLHTIRTLEAGLQARIRQGSCKAVGTLDVTEAHPTREDGLHIFLEHSDGTAYQLIIPYTNRGIGESAHGNAVTTSLTPKFFLSVIGRSA